MSKYVDPNYIVSQPMKSHVRRDLKISWIAAQCGALAVLLLLAVGYGFVKGAF